MESKMRVEVISHGNDSEKSFPGDQEIHGYSEDGEEVVLEKNIGRSRRDTIYAFWDRFDPICKASSQSKIPLTSYIVDGDKKEVFCEEEHIIVR